MAWYSNIHKLHNNAIVKLLLSLLMLLFFVLILFYLNFYVWLVGKHYIDKLRPQWLSSIGAWDYLAGTCGWICTFVWSWSEWGSDATGAQESSEWCVSSRRLEQSDNQCQGFHWQEVRSRRWQVDGRWLLHANVLASLSKDASHCKSEVQT